MPDNRALPVVCAAPVDGAAERISLAHGEGGRLTRRLIQEVIVPALCDPRLATIRDAAEVPTLSGPSVMTTDSYVVTPLFFPGGDIGQLAVYGTVNDLCVAGGRPRWMSLALILEEGLPMATLRAVLTSVAAASRASGVQVVTGDTKVVPRSAADGLFLCATGLGEYVWSHPLGPQMIQTGDQLLVSGPIGRHGVAVLAAREGLGFDPPPQSDCGSLFPAVEALRVAGIPVRAMRDATRGGLSAVLHEWAQSSGWTMSIREEDVPVTDEVRGVCELLGLDPLHVACEGTFVVALPPEAVEAALAALRSTEVGRHAVVVGSVRAKTMASVLVRRGLGREIPLDEPAGAPLPRIC